jgi:hypothetical protein
MFNHSSSVFDVNENVNMSPSKSMASSFKSNFTFLSSPKTMDFLVTKGSGTQFTRNYLRKYDSPPKESVAPNLKLISSDESFRKG